MSPRLVLLAGIFLLLAALLNGGIYQLSSESGEGPYTHRMNRFTGSVSYCRAMHCQPVTWHAANW